MAEAGKVGHWAILGKMNESAAEEGVQELDRALPIQELHLETVREGSLELAGSEDPELLSGQGSAEEEAGNDPGLRALMQAP